MNEQQKQPNEAQGEDEPVDFERALGRIEAIVRTLEEGRGGLDESLSLYEEGVKLLRRCHGLLRKAEQRIEMLAGIDDAGEAITEPFDARETFSSSSVSTSPTSSSSSSSLAAAPDDETISGPATRRRGRRRNDLP